MSLSANDFEAAGYVAEKKMMLGDWVDTGVYKLPNWSPIPKIDFASNLTGFASIGSQQWFLRSLEDLHRFTNKAVPTFCEPV